MNFGFSCFRKLACCLPQIYKWASNSYVDQPLSQNSPKETDKRDAPLLGTLTPTVTNQGDWISVAASDDRYYAIASDGSLWGWGRGILGNGKTDSLEMSPAFIDEGPWLKVDTTIGTAVGIKSNKTLWQWGHSILPERYSTPTTNAVIRAILSSPIAGAVVTVPGKYSKTPSVSIEKRKKTASGYGVYEWPTASSDQGAGATAEAVMNYTASNEYPNRGFVVTNPGSGYTSIPTGTITDGELSINATVEMSFKATSVRVTNGGSGYSSKPTVLLNSFVSQGGTAATAQVTKMGVVVTSATVTAGGSGYKSSPAVLVNGILTDKIIANVEDGRVSSLDVLCGFRVDDDTVDITFLSGSGSGAEATATSRMNHVVEVTLTTQGSGYYRVPTVSFSGGGGSGAAATAAATGFVTGVTLPYLPKPTFTGFSSPPSLVLTGGGFTTPAEVEIQSLGVVKGIKITNAGSGYTSNGKTFAPVAIFTRQSGDRYSSSQSSSQQNDAFAICHVEPTSISAINVVSEGSGYSTERLGKVSSFSVTFANGYTRLYLQAGNRIEDLTKTGPGDYYSTWSFSESSGWPYRPILVTVDSSGQKRGGWYEYGKNLYDGMPTPRHNLDVLFSAPSADEIALSGSDARATAVVNASGGISSVVVSDPGVSYKYEPDVTVSHLLIYPRQVGTATWKDVACGNTGDWFCVAISDSDSLVYRWGRLLNIEGNANSPTKLGKRLIGSTGTLNFSNFSYPWYYVPPPDLPGVPALVSTSTYYGYSYNLYGGVFYPRIGSRPKSDGTGIENYGRSDGYTYLYDTGLGYTSVPASETSSSATISLSLYGPDQCRSVFTHGDKAYAIDSSGKLWRLNSTSAAPHGPVDTISEVSLLHIAADGKVTYSYEDQVDTSRGINYGTYQSCPAYYLTSGGTGYGDQCKLMVTGTKHRWRIVKRYTVQTSSDEKNPGFYTTDDSLYGSGTITEDDYEPRAVFTASPSGLFGSGVYSWQQSIFYPSLLSFNPNNTVSSRVSVPANRSWTDKNANGVTIRYHSETYSLSSVCTDLGSPYVHDPSGGGSGAVYTLAVSSLGMVQSGGVGPVCIGSGTTWDFCTGGKWVPHGRTSGGSLLYVNDIGSVWSGSLTGSTEQRTVSEYPGEIFPASEQLQYISVNGTLGVLPDQSMRELPYIDGTYASPYHYGRTRPSRVQGDVELIVQDKGRGYTEPVVAKFSSQPEGAATITSTIDGKLTAVAVVGRGSGYNSVPSISVVDDSGGGSGASVVGVISGPVLSITVTSPGSGYRVPPKVEFSQPGISARAVSSLNSGGGVESISVTSGGEYRSPPSVTFTPVPDVESVSITSGGDGYSQPPSVVIVGGYGTGASASSVIDGKVVSIVVAKKGSGYTSLPTIRISPSVIGETAAGYPIINTATGELEAIAITDPGSMYQSPPQVFIEGGGGSGAMAYCKIAGPVASVNLTHRGSGYYESPSVFFIGGGGTGAEATASTASPGSGAQATARINGELLYCDVTNGGSGYNSTPRVVISGGDNIFIDNANEMYSNEQISEEQKDAIIDQHEAKCMARIAGPPTFTLQDGGDRYGENPDGTRYEMGRESGYFKRLAFRVLGPDTRGTIRGIDESTWYGMKNGVYSPLAYNGRATSASTEPPGGPLTSVSSAEFANVKFTAPPLAIPEDAHGIIARTSMRLCGIALESSKHPLVQNSSWYNPFSGVYSSFRSAQSYAASVTFRLAGSLDEGNGLYPLSPGKLPQLRMFYCKSSLQDRYLSQNTRFHWQQYQFDELPTIQVESDTGSQAVVTVSTGGDGLASASMSQGGVDYGTLVKVTPKGGKTKVSPASATAVMSGGRVVDIIVNTQGGGYTSPPTVVIHGGGGEGASAVAVIGQQKTSIGLPVPSGVLRIDLINCGSGYTSTPSVTIVSQNKVLADLPLYDGSRGTYKDVDFSSAIGLVDPRLEFVELTGDVSDPDRRMSICAYPVVNARFGNTGYSLSSDACVFFDEGYLDTVTLESSFGAYESYWASDSAYESPQFYKRLPDGVAVELSGQCESQAVVDVIRPKWSNVVHGNGALIAVRDTTQP